MGILWDADILYKIGMNSSLILGLYITGPECLFMESFQAYDLRHPLIVSSKKVPEFPHVPVTLETVKEE